MKLSGLVQAGRPQTAIAQCLSSLLGMK